MNFSKSETENLNGECKGDSTKAFINLPTFTFALLHREEDLIRLLIEEGAPLTINLYETY